MFRLSKVLGFGSIAAAAVAIGLAAPAASAGTVALGAAADYGLLYEGNGGKSLQMNNSNLTGNVGVGNTGEVALSGGIDIFGRIDFSAANTGQFSTSGSTTYTGPFYNVSAVTSALTRINKLSEALQGFYGQGESLAIDAATATFDLTTGTHVLKTVDFDGQSQNIYIVDLTSFDNGKNGSGVLTIKAGANDLVAFNMTGLGDFEFKNDMVLTGGITADQIVWNFGAGNYTTLSGGNKLTINNTQSQNDFARGIFLDPNGAISISDSYVYGRVFGGDSVNMAYVSGANLEAPSPPAVPLPPAVWSGLGVLAAFGAVRRLRRPRDLTDAS
jgi:hypothetical protein